MLIGLTVNDRADIQPTMVQSSLKWMTKLRSPSPVPLDPHSFIPTGPWLSFLNFENAYVGISGKEVVDTRLPPASTLESFSTLFSKLTLGEIEIPLPTTSSEYGEDRSRAMTERFSGITTKGSPGYIMMQLFLLANNFTFFELNDPDWYHIPIQERARIHDERVIKLIQQAGSSNIASIKAVLSEKNPVAEAIREQVFAAALRTANLGLLQAILDTGFNPNITIALSNGRHGSPTREAAMIKDERLSLEIIQLLIRNGVVVRKTGSGQLSAVKLGHKEVVRVLIEAGARSIIAAIMSRDEELVRRTALNIGPAINRLHSLNYGTELTALAIAASSSDIAVTKALIECGADLNAPQTLGCQELFRCRCEKHFCYQMVTTPLGIAASKGRLRMVRFLLGQKAVINPPNLKGSSRFITPLFAACHNGHRKVARVLVESGASVSDSGASGLSYYFSTHRKEFLEALLSGEGDSDQAETTFLEELISKAADSNNAPRRATYQSPYNLQSLILDLNLPPEVILELTGETLVYASETELANIIKKCSTANTTITRAVNKVSKIGTLELAKVLQERGLLPGILSQNGPQILIQAIHSRHEGSNPVDALSRENNLIDYLLAHQSMDITEAADPGEIYIAPATPLEAAAMQGDLRLVTTLLERGAPLCLSTFHFATYPESGRRCQELLRLLQSFASSNSTKWIMQDFETHRLACRAALRFDDIFQTLREIFSWDSKQIGRVLAAAIEIQRFHLISPLLDAGASVNEGYRSYNWTSGTGDLRRLYFNTYYPLVSLIGTTKISHEEIFRFVKQLVEKGADVNQEEGSSRTALQAAVCSGNLAVVEFLLKEGADANNVPTPDRFHEIPVTALQYAAINGDLAIALCLLKAGADINAARIGEYGRTALEGATQNGRLEMVNLLLQWSPKIEGDYRQSYLNAISLAVELGHEAVANMLRLYGDRISSHTSASEAPGTDEIYSGTFGDAKTIQSDYADGSIPEDRDTSGDEDIPEDEDSSEDKVILDEEYLYEEAYILGDISEDSESEEESVTHDNPESHTVLVGHSWATNDTATEEVGQSNEGQGNLEGWEKELLYVPEHWRGEDDISLNGLDFLGQEVNDIFSDQLFEPGLFSGFQCQETTGYVEQSVEEETFPRSNFESSADFLCGGLMDISEFGSFFP